MAKAISENVFLNIPTPVIQDSLSRLTPDEVGRCRCVCKDWLDLLSKPEFVKLHLSKSQTCLFVHNNHSLSASFSLVQVEDETNHRGVRYKAPIPREIPRSSQSFSRTMIGSIDGLVCINEITSQFVDLIHVWNPITGEFITIQPPDGEEKPQCPNVATYGFGISSGKYHVVRIFQIIGFEATGQHIPGSTSYIPELILGSTCHVYTLGTGFRKNIGPAPYLYSSVRHGLFLNGNLHWLVYDKNSPEQICCLDLESESFKPFPPPPELPKSPFFTTTLNVYKGCISVCDNPSVFGDLVIWVMKEYGVQNSWTKEVVISKYLINHVSVNREDCRILKVFEDGEILLLWRKYKLFSYHPKTKTVQDFGVRDTMTSPSIDTSPSCFRMFPCIEATDYVSSLVSIKKLGEVNVNRA